MEFYGSATVRLTGTYAFGQLEGLTLKVCGQYCLYIFRVLCHIANASKNTDFSGRI